MRLSSLLSCSATACLLLAAMSCSNRSGTEESSDSSSSMDKTAAVTLLEGESTRFQKKGFAAFEDDGRLWVFKRDSEALAEYLRVGEPAKSATMIAVGPGGYSMRAEDKAIIAEYIATKPGFYAHVEDGRCWVLKEGSEAYDMFKKVGEPAKSITLIGAGPLGLSLRSDSKETAMAWKGAKDGYYTTVHDGRYWVLAEGSESLEQFKAVGEPAKSVTLIGAGPDGMSLRSDSKDTILSYKAAAHGFNTYVREGRIWVFEPGSEDEAEFLRVGEPAKSVTRIAAGPDGVSVRSPSGELIDAYLRSLANGNA